MKKLFYTLLIICSFAFITNVDALSSSISANKTTAYVGDSVTVTISISGANSVTIQSIALNGTHLEGWNDANLAGDKDWSKTLTLNTSTAGTYTYTVKGTIASASLQEVDVNKSITITVNERPPQYTVTFNANGHGSAPNSQQVESGSKARDPGSISASGWTFGGWYTESRCINRFDFNTPITGNITLHAKWTAVPTQAPPTTGKTNPTQGTTQPTQGTTQPTQGTTQPTQPGETTTTTTETTTTVEAPIIFDKLTVGDYPVEFKNNNYYVTVSSNVEEIEVGGTVPEGYTVEGFGTRTLAIGKNQVDLTITTADGRTAQYVLIITRPDPNVVTSTKLIKLKVSGYEINFKPDVTEYTIKVPKDVEELHIDAEAENSAVKINGIGDITLAEGKNILKVTVSYGELNSTSYTITVEREESNFMLILVIALLVGGLGIGAFFVVKSNKDKKENKVNEEAAEEAREEVEESENATSTVGGEEVFGVGRRLVEPTLVGIEEAPDNYVDEPINYVANAGEINEDSNFVKPIEIDTDEEAPELAKENKEDIFASLQAGEKEDKVSAMFSVPDKEEIFDKKENITKAEDTDEYEGNISAKIAEEAEKAEQELVSDTIKIKYSIDQGDEEALDKVKDLLEDKEDNVSSLSEEDIPSVSLDELTKDVLEDNVKTINDEEGSSEHQVKVVKKEEKKIPKPLKKIPKRVEE